MMDFPLSHPVWMWLYFGFFGIAGAVLFTLVVWYAMKARNGATGQLRRSATWSMVGYLFLFLSSYAACGIGGPPGNLLSSTPGLADATFATIASMMAIAYSVPGWACILVAECIKLRMAK
ncbi:MAG: hypothetical protein AB1597_00285 [Chloroflexota bacterium]